MSLRATRFTLWVLMFCTAPVPYMLGVVETAPPIRLLLFTALTVAVRFSEGSGGYVWTIFILLGVVQIALYAVGLYYCASLVSRTVARATPLRRGAAVAAIAIVVVVIAVSYPIYETPMSSQSIHSTLLQVFR